MAPGGRAKERVWQSSTGCEDGRGGGERATRAYGVMGGDSESGVG